ncbi:MAG TPA: allophanate hydrolase [Rhodocyclaceae bacterium]|nr:allophanate hydrolase [Rhodocyclaceae bacterium]
MQLDIQSLRAAYLDGSLTPIKLVEEIILRTSEDTHQVWIHRLPDDTLRAYAHLLDGADPKLLPLYGIPFAIKDNIDLVSVPTTAGCPDYAYVPDKNAFVVQKLIDAGAIPIGKTNLDQFATGLNGTRSPYGACHNSFNPEYISGGSSSGSAVAVALGYCSFSLGTDTAGSGRVPAAFNNLVGHKPTCGWLSANGVVPACRSLDTISIFALTAEDAETITTVAASFDEGDAFARPVEAHGFDFGRAKSFRFGVPRNEDLQFFGNTEAEKLFYQSVAHLQDLGGEKVEIDLAPFLETARLLYEGPWVAERYAAIREFFDTQPESTLPVIQTILGGAKKWTAADAYRYGYQLKTQKRICDAIWKQVDCVVTPTAGTIYTIEEMLAEPIKYNSNLGYYTNFMNLLDYAATAVPAGFQEDGLPFGVTLFAPSHQDGPLLHLAARLQRTTVSTSGALEQRLPDINEHAMLPGGMIKLAVCGAHMSGLPLNWQLTDRGGRLVTATYSAPEYQLYALAGGPPQRPGMVRVSQGGVSIALEVWELPVQHYGSFVAGIPAPLGIGMVRLIDGTSVQGFVCESAAVAEARDISYFGGWRRFLGTP